MPKFSERPTDYIYARLAEQAYEPKGGKDLPANWEVLEYRDKTDNDGYFGVAYQYKATKQIIIAHRGAHLPTPEAKTPKLPKEILEKISDMFLGLKKYADELSKSADSSSAHIDGIIRLMITSQQISAVEFALEIKKNYPDHTVSFAGHSLGGWLAQLCTYHFMVMQEETRDTSWATWCVTLESPGARDIIEAIHPGYSDKISTNELGAFLDCLDITNYLSSPNLINSCNRHLGTVYRLYIKFPMTSDWFKREIDQWRYSYNSHQVVNLVPQFNAVTGSATRLSRVVDWPQVQWPDRNEVAKLDTEGPIEWLVKQCSNVIPLPDAVTSFVTKPLDAGVKKLIDSTRATRGFYKIAQVFRDYATGIINKDEYDGFFKFANKGNQYVPAQGAMSFSENYRLKHEYHYATKPYDSNGLHLRHVDRDLRKFLLNYAKPAQKNLLRQHPELKELPQAVWDDLNAYEITQSMLIEKISWEMRVKDSPEENPVSALVLCRHISQHLSKYPILQHAIDQDSNIIFAKKLHKTLKEYYASKNEIKGLFGRPLQLKDQYINLQLIYQSQKVEENDKKPPEEQKKEKDDDFWRHFKQKQALALEQLFFPANALLLENQKTHEKNPDVSPDFLLIQGDAGTGKTTMIDYIAYKWEKGELWQELDWIFTLRLRDLREKEAIAAWERGEIWSLSGWVYQALFAGKDFDKANFKSAWKEQIEPAIEQGKVLFILDGYDEMPSEHPCKNALEKLLLSTQIKKIITSRPYGTSSLREDRRNVEVVGFLDENIKKYVEFYYASQAEKSKQLLIALEANPILWNHAHIPVLLNILCGILEKVKNEDLARKLETLNTRSSLYDEMELSLLERAYIHESKDKAEIKKRGEQLESLTTLNKSVLLYKHYKALRQQLAAIAFEVFTDKQLVISSKHLNDALERTGVKVDDIKTQTRALTDLGLLKPAVNNSGSEASSTQGYEFLHLSFKEYYVAQYLSTLFEDNVDVLTPPIKHVLARMKLNPHYQEHLWFLAGTLRNKPKQFKRLLDYLIITQPDKIGNYELGLLVMCTEEALDAKWNAADRRSILFPIMKLIQNKIEKIYAKHFSPGFFGSADPNVSIPFYVDMLRRSPRWQQLTGEEDIFYLISDVYFVNSKIALVGYFRWLNLISPQASRWLSYFLWSDKFEKKVITNPGTRMWSNGQKAYVMFGEQSYMRDIYPVHDACIEAIVSIPRMAIRTEIISSLIKGLHISVVSKYTTFRGSYYDSCKKALVHLCKCANPEILDALIAGLKDKKIGWACMSIIAESKVAISNPKILDILTLGLCDKDHRWACATTLGDMGAAVATPGVLAALSAGEQDRDKGFRELCTDALKKITMVVEMKPITSPVVKLQSKGKHETLAGINTAEEKSNFLSVFTKRLREDRYCLASSYCYGWDIRSLAEDLEFKSTVLDLLTKGLHDKNEYYRRNCVKALGEMGNVAVNSEALILLREGLGGNDDSYREQYIEALSKIYAATTPTSEIMDILMEICLAKPGWFKSYQSIRYAAEALRTLGTTTPNIINTTRLIILLSAVMGNPTHSLRELFTNWTCIYLKQNPSFEKESDFSILLALFVGAYMQGNVSMTIGWSGKNYTLQGYVHQDFFALQLSPKQAQWIQHYSPKIISLLEQGRWASITVDHLECPDWTPLIMSGVMRSRRVLPPPEHDDLLLKLSL